LPGLLSLVRLPLAVAFPFTVGHVPLAVATMAMAGISDVLDGWVARRTGRSSTTGALLDPIMDKAFVLTALVTLLVVGRLTFPAILLLMARELLELPLVAWAATQPSQVVAHRRELRANREGKATTMLQFATLFAALVEPRWVMSLAVAAGVSGLVATATYARRTLHQLRE
jgi:CDP-diacylglycerol--glycerol-3-phosphate 3-phosphatidyltransferase/cardiolipin synthase